MLTHNVTDEHIRKSWFPDHQPEYSIFRDTDGNNIERLLWRKPETNIYMVDYMRKDGYLWVTGDIGCATYWWSGSNSLRWISSCNLGYFAEKCEASENGRDFEEFSNEALEKRLEELWADTDWEDNHGYPVEEAREKFENTSGPSAAQDCQGMWTAWCMDHAQDVFGDEWYEWVPSGMTLNCRCLGHLVGLRMAFEQLEEEVDNTI